MLLLRPLGFEIFFLSCIPHYDRRLLCIVITFQPFTFQIIRYNISVLSTSKLIFTLSGRRFA
ncbi:hypothetical protein HanRHA438_Chr05g0231011 [Helianthus annuus]|nr:hypothetical protein HanRHA438_Chr05g0231011 [Helianthus annuus]